MTFEFTREQREAWRVFRPIALEKWLECALEDFDAAAARFDEREKTCGIEPNSYEHGLLMISQHVGLTQFGLNRPSLKPFVNESGIANEDGRELVSRLNAMCKVQA